MMTTIESDENTEYVYTGPNLAKDMEELKMYREERRRAADRRVHWKRIMEEAKAKRAEARANAEVREVTAETVAHAFNRFTSLDIGAAYIEHFVQPYCECGPEEGWEFCEHAKDQPSLFLDPNS